MKHSQRLCASIFVVLLSACTLSACGGGGGGSAAPAAVAAPGGGAPPPAPPPAGTGSATLNWMPPTFYTDGITPLAIQGYKFYAGTSQGNLSLIDNVANGGIATYMATGLATGTTWFFAVTAYDAMNVESTFSNVASKTL